VHLSIHGGSNRVLAGLSDTDLAFSHREHPIGGSGEYPLKGRQRRRVRHRTAPFLIGGFDEVTESRLVDLTFEDFLNGFDLAYLAEFRTFIVALRTISVADICRRRCVVRSRRGCTDIRSSPRLRARLRASCAGVVIAQLPG
jgi:hypothetical protein